MSKRHWIIERTAAVVRSAHVLSAFFLGIFILLFVIFLRTDSREGGGEVVPDDRPNGAIEVYFTAPDKAVSKTLRGGPDAQLASSIAGAQRSVDLAAYNLDLWSIRDALLEAYRSGAVVRVVVESTNFDAPEIQDLVEAGIVVVPDTSEALMHHKFVIVDQWDVWMGSMNFTLNGAYRNDNNLVHFQSVKLARDYEREFEEMFIEGRFGRLSKRDTPFPELTIGSTDAAVYFSPDDGVLAGVLSALDHADEQVLVMAYTLTADEIAERLIEQSRAGLDVRVLLEAGQVASTGNDFEQLRASDVDVRKDGNPYNMHHKTIIIDGQIVVTGSYNFTRSAEERNDENLLIIYDQAVAGEYLIEFTRLWDAAE